MKFLKRIFTSLFLMTFILVFSGCGTATVQTYKIKLEIWGLFDESVVYDGIISSYQKINPYIEEIKYKKLSVDTYKQDIVEAMASGQGPDIVLLNNSWIPYFANKISPAPQGVINEQEFKSNFVTVASDDFIYDGKIYATPLSVDSLALFYNRATFNAAGITTPPKSWSEFNDVVRKLTTINDNGEILKSGVAMGTAQNVNRPTDILSLLMMQLGVVMPSQKNPEARFNEGVMGSDGLARQAGNEALSYYTNFAKLTLPPTNTPNPLACWNFRMHYSIDAFVEETAAMMFNYSWQIETIKKQNPKMNFAITPVPQFNPGNPVNIANYWGYTVSKNKMEIGMGANGQQQYVPISQAKNDARIHEAWQFLKFLTFKNNGSVRLTNAISKNFKDFPVSIDPALEYAKKTNKPAARYDIIEMQKADALLFPFVSGNLIAKSWYNVDADASENVLSEMIDSVVRGDSNTLDALKLATERVNNLNIRK